MHQHETVGGNKAGNPAPGSQGFINKASYLTYLNVHDGLIGHKTPGVLALGGIGRTSDAGVHLAVEV